MVIQARPNARRGHVLGFLAYCHGVTGAALGILLVIVIIEARHRQPVLDKRNGRDISVCCSHTFIEYVTGGALPLHGRT